MKRLICLLLLLTTLFCACTPADTGETVTTEAQTVEKESEGTAAVSSVESSPTTPIRYRRVYEKTALHERYPELSLNGPMYIKDDLLHVVDTTQGMLHLFDREGIHQTSLSLPITENRTLLLAYPMSEDRFVLAEQWLNKNFTQIYTVRVVNADGEELCAMDIEQACIDYTVSVYEEYNTVHLLLVMNANLYYFSCSGSTIQVFSMPEIGYVYAQYVYSGSGKFTRLLSNSSKTTYDFYNDMVKETPLRMPEKYQYATLYRGADMNYYIRDNGNLYLLKSDDQMERVLNGIESGMPNKNVQYQTLVIHDDCTFWTQEQNKLYLYRVSLVEDTEDRQEISLVVMDLKTSREWLEASVSQFNNQNTEYYVSLEYFNYASTTDPLIANQMDAALQELLLYHQHPDILMVDDPYVLSKYEDKKIYADLNQLLDVSVLGCIQEAFGSDDALYLIPMMMRVDTFAASTDVSSGFLTYERFYEIIDGLAPGEVLCGPGFNSTFYQNALMDFVDFESKTTSYHSETFYKVVRYREQLASLTDFYAGALSYGYMISSYGSYGADDTYWTSNGTLPTALKNGSVKFLAMNFNTIEAYSAAKLLFGDTPFTLCGYPSVDGCGARINTYLPTAVFADSDVMSGCKEFMEFLLSDARQTDALLTDRNLPVTRSALERAIDSSRTYWYPTVTVNHLREGNQPGYLNLNAYRGEKTEGYVSVSIGDDDKAEILSFFENCHMRANTDPFILSIVNEELSFYEGNARTLEETTKIIDSRVWIYINE